MKYIIAVTTFLGIILYIANNAMIVVTSIIVISSLMMYARKAYKNSFVEEIRKYYFSLMFSLVFTVVSAISLSEEIDTMYPIFLLSIFYAYYGINSTFQHIGSVILRKIKEKIW